ncbi:bifunctional Eukaryotic porin-Tom40/Porin domain superfamily/Tom40 [Babesia duncani]|uniref:Bifunctional Eukaryotic porin-Tom40/Porin domain superfamily/Tom40 n=1 Tax=Babesia duncani TaxID=323732 RepID=A0AAD9PNE9_9APIC|nr:bifunctional Eukaryotic porin-Tom40/Porin domain superfamily/Tom40 [Babesia duncani]
MLNSITPQDNQPASVNGSTNSYCIRDSMHASLSKLVKHGNRASNRLLETMSNSNMKKYLNVAHCDVQGVQMDQPPISTPYDLLTFENLSREYKYVMTQDNYDGFRLEADRQITPNLQSSHTLFLGTLLRDVGYIYQMGANYASTDGKNLVMAKIGLDGMITARGLSKIGGFEIKGSGNSFLRYDNRNAYELGVDYVGNNWTGSLKTAWQGTWILNAAYSQQIIPQFSLGSELTYIVANRASIGAIAARLVLGDSIITFQCSKQPNFKTMDLSHETNSARIQYTRKINDRLSLATELELTPDTRESALRMGWDYLFRHARVQGNIDTCGRIAMQAQDFSGFGVSGCIDYVNNIYRFGFMMHLLPPPPEQRESQEPQAPENLPEYPN